MKIRLLLQAAFFLVFGSQSFSAQAQSDFKPGYIVQPSGDTLRGQVQLRGALRSALLCRFRPAATAAITEYQPTELRGYGVDNIAFYEARRLPRPTQKGDSPAFTQFLTLLASGKATLYSRRDNDDQTHFYLALNADSLQELRQLKVQRVVNGQQYIETEYPFRRLLAHALRDCPAVQSLLPALQLTAGQLTTVVTRYNACVGSPATSRPQLRIARERQQVSFGVVGGTEYSKVQFSSTLREHNGKFTATGSPVVGVFVALTTPALNRHLAFRFDALYEHLHYESAYVSTEGSTVPVYQQASFTVNYLCLPLQVRYNFLSGSVHPYILAGLSFNLLLNYDTHLHSEYNAGSTPVVYDGIAVADSDVARLDNGLVGGVGITTSALAGRAIGLEVRAENSSGFLETGTPSPITRVRALLSINLTK